MRAKTDIAGVRAMAINFLYLDIQRTKFSPMVVQHPFTNSGIIAVSKDGAAQMLDLLNKSEDLSAWRDALRQRIDEADSPATIFLMLNKPYALAFLKFTQKYLSKADFSDLLSHVWVLTECPNQDVDVSRRELVSMFRKADPVLLMDKDELRQLGELDDPVTVYRGVTSYNGDDLRALSWTLDEKIADWFAHRFGEDGMVYQAQARKSDIFALFNGRNESEIVLDPKGLMGIEPVVAEEQTPDQEMKMN